MLTLRELQGAKRTPGHAVEVYCMLIGCMQVRRVLKDKGSLQLMWGMTLYHLDDLTFDVKDTADVFTPFKNKVCLCFVVSRLLTCCIMTVLHVYITCYGPLTFQEFAVNGTTAGVTSRLMSCFPI